MLPKGFGFACCVLLAASVGANPIGPPAADPANGPLRPDPEVKMDACQMVIYHGYPCATYSVTTEDGYILNLHRIINGRGQKAENAPNDRPVVFLQHGLLCDSTNWISNLPSESLGFILADAGFDVWMGNFRGNTYSKKHTTLDPRKHQYWKFSWDHMAAYDLPAMINFTLRSTHQKQVYYVGHSEGTMTMFAKLADQEFAKMIKTFYALAPVSTVGSIKGPLHLIAKWTDQLETLFNLIGYDEFLPATWLMDLLARFVCGSIITNPLCRNVLFLIAGPESNQLNNTRIPVYVSHTPSGTSTQNIAHFGQMINSRLFCKYDYQDKEENFQHYGQTTPPEYDLGKVLTPTHLFWADDDWLADPTDVGILRSKLPPASVVGDHYYEGFNHLDFIWGLRAAPEIYAKIVTDIRSAHKRT